MPLTSEQVGQIALQMLQAEMESKGLPLNPREIKRQTANQAKKFGIPEARMAEFAKIIMGEASRKTMAALEEMISKDLEPSKE